MPLKEHNLKAEPTEMDSLLESLQDESLKVESETPTHRRHQSLPWGNSRPPRKGLHHRRKSSVRQLFGSFSDGLGSIKEGLELEATVIRDTFSRELEDANEGRKYFLDMSMARSLSLLPESLSEFAEEAGVSIREEEPSKNPWDGWIPCFGLLAAVLAVSSNGAAFAMLDNVQPAMKLYWRMTVTSLVLSPFAIKQIRIAGLPEMKTAQWMTFGGATVCFTLSALLMVTAFEYTSIGNAVIGANSQAILLILGKFLVGESVVAMEGCGVFIAFIGCILCSSDEAKGGSSEVDGARAIFGDFLGLLAGVMGVGYLTFAKAVRGEMPVTVFMFMNMACGSFLILTFMLVFGIPVFLNNDPHSGLFGWANLFHNRIFLLLHIALVCNVVGTMGFVRAMKHFDNIIIAVATLLEPMMATIIAFVLGIGGLPGFIGWVGNLLVILGTLGVVYPSIDKSTDH